MRMARKQALLVMMQAVRVQRLHKTPQLLSLKPKSVTIRILNQVGHCHRSNINAMMSAADCQQGLATAQQPKGSRIEVPIFKPSRAVHGWCCIKAEKPLSLSLLMFFFVSLFVSFLPLYLSIPLSLSLSLSLSRSRSRSLTLSPSIPLSLSPSLLLSLSPSLSLFLRFTLSSLVLQEHTCMPVFVQSCGARWLAAPTARKFCNETGLAYLGPCKNMCLK